MAYVIGIDLGTTASAAAVFRDGRAEVVSIGTRAPAIPSVVVLGSHGDVLVGEAAEHRALSEPTRTAREFKRRLGDPIPILLGGTPYGAEALMGHLLRHVYERVVEQQGMEPDLTVVTHPANYGPYKLDLLGEAVRLADIAPVSFLPEPEAAAIEYAQRERLDPGQVVAVYDFGGGTFDAAVLRKAAAGFDLLGTPEGMDRVGGIDFDQAVFAHVDATLDGLVAETDTGEPAALAALSRLRDDCRVAKEALSTDTDAAIPVMLPHVQTEVRLTRAELETMIAPRITETIAALQRALRSAGVGSDDVTKVLLVGGTSRIPLVAEMVHEATSIPVAVDAHPKLTIALGAAIAGGSRLPETIDDVAVPTPLAPAVEAPPPDTSVAPAAPAPVVARSQRRPVLWIVGVVAVLAVGVLLFVVASGGEDGGGDGAPATQPTLSPPTTAAALTVIDDFGDPASGWPRQETRAAAARYAGGEYVIELGSQAVLHRFVRAGVDALAADVTVEVTEKRRSEDTTFTGLLCRSDSTGAVAYAAVVNRRGGWAIMQTAADPAALRTLAEGEDGPTAASPTGRRLRLSCTGGTGGSPARLELHVDDRLVGEATDDSPLPAGQSGLVAVGQAGAALAFDDFRATAHPSGESS